MAEAHWSAIEDIPKLNYSNPMEIHKLLDTLPIIWEHSKEFACEMIF